jgi:hypothetical protein
MEGLMVILNVNAYDAFILGGKNNTMNRILF